MSSVTSYKGVMKLSREKFVEARHGASISQANLARAVGMHVATLRSFEQGRTKVLNAGTLALLCRELGIPMESLFEDTPEAALTGGQA